MDVGGVDEVGQAAMVLTKVEMDIVCASERQCNLNVLLMNVATRESELEISYSEKEEIPAEKGLEFDLLCGILDSEVKELDNFFSLLGKEIAGVREIKLFNSSEGMVEGVRLFEEKLHDCEDSLKHSQGQLDDMKMQSADLQKSLPILWNHEQTGGDAQDGHVSGSNPYLEDKVHMQTGEQQRNVLRLLEKSLARELDLDMKLNEARQIEEELKLKLQISRQEASFFEEEAMTIWAQCLEAENAGVVLMGISKDLLSQLQIFHFKLNCLTQNRDQLKSDVEDLATQLEAKNDEINIQNTEMIRLKKNNEDLEGKLSTANCKAITAEAECKVLEETNSKLNEELNHLKDTSSAEIKSMENQLKDLNLELQHKLAAEEASQENQSMLNFMVGDMENLIKDLNAKVSYAECRADDAEAKYIVLSESNAELKEEVSFFRKRLEVLEASMYETNERKIESAKNIEMRATAITSLVMQLAVERDRLHAQLLSLAKKNKSLAVRLEKVSEGKFAADTSKRDVAGRSHSLHESNFTKKDKDCWEEFRKVDSMNSKISDGTSIFSHKAETGNSRSTSELETVRTIDARELYIKHLIFSSVLMVMSTAVYFYLK